MRSPATSSRTKGPWNISDAGPKFGSTKLATVIVRAALMLALLSALVLIAALPSQAQIETVFYSFCSQPNCADGAEPIGNLVMDAQGNVYGTTEYGGVQSCGYSGCGTLFKLTPSGSETVLHNFHRGMGSYPGGSLIFDAKGNLYGTTFGIDYVGLYGSNFFGSVFKLEKRSYRFLARFTAKNQEEGAKPSPGLLLDAQGNIYGTTSYGGANPCAELGVIYGCGTVFKLTSSGTETVLYNFAGGADAKNPNGSLIVDSAGSLYGTSDLGGVGRCTLETEGCGTVFKVTSGGTETVLYTFTGGVDGARPSGGLVMDDQGNLYGTTPWGGTGCGGVGCGTVFKVTPDGTETVLHNFAGGTDGSTPSAGLVRDGQGNLYGTTALGGGTGCYEGAGCGTVFEVTAGGAYSVLYRFTGGADGALPFGGLVLDVQGNFYGTTIAGGVGGCSSYGGVAGCGVVFKVTP